ncbi:MAG: hybrid sensor histidine kinase/response regulator [Deltaproteobacteria bacterium]|nr:hybrid sensor histidine kinase/response regulator [Nannocystaceae bacterium]
MTAESIKVLLVDDIEENLLVLEALLRRDGLTILTAGSGAAALELLLVHDVALALLDVQMPEMDGFELAELMRGSQRTKHVPIIFVTAGARDPGRAFKGYESGAVDFLYKPIEAHILRSKADVFFELYRQRRDLAEALRLNELFVGILGHDLRNPLGAMLTGAQLLEQELVQEGQRRILRRMSSAGARMTGMIEQLLDLTRARLGGGLGFARMFVQVELGELVHRVADELRGRHPEREIVIDVHGAPELVGDPDRLLQLLSNLLANALEHGAASVPIRVRADANDAEVCIALHNGGMIPPALMPTIFDPFRGRAHGSVGGLGLGLFISRQIAVAHGGTLVVESSEQGGTTFTLRLPNRAAP